jgi:hypothetical protein
MPRSEVTRTDYWCMTRNAGCALLASIILLGGACGADAPPAADRPGHRATTGPGDSLARLSCAMLTATDWLEAAEAFSCDVQRLVQVHGPSEPTRSQN